MSSLTKSKKADPSPCAVAESQKDERNKKGVL